MTHLNELYLILNKYPLKMEQVTFKVLCAHHACDYFKANM
ncbi:putative transposase [Acinetobacter baumannii 1043903]|nr:putative transposase [Acinetobacter baumannii 1043903]